MGCRGCVPCATSVRSTVSMTRWHPSRVFRQERVFLSCCRPLAGWPRCMGHAENIASARTQFIGDHARCSGQNRPSKVHALRAVLARKLSAVSNSALFKAFTVMRLRKARRGSGWWACLALAIEADIIRYRVAPWHRSASAMRETDQKYRASPGTPAKLIYRTPGRWRFSVVVITGGACQARRRLSYTPIERAGR